VLAGCSDITTLTQFAFRDPRADLFFTPWDQDAVRSFLGIMSALPAGVR
jgi:hypothetical protein